MQDEQRVALWVAHIRGEYERCLYVSEVETRCRQWWAERGVRRQSSTWLRAFWRARASGMLGPVEPGERVGGRMRYRITGRVADIRKAAGKDHKTIPHGNHASRHDATEKPQERAGAIRARKAGNAKANAARTRQRGVAKT